MTLQLQYSIGILLALLLVRAVQCAVYSNIEDHNIRSVVSEDITACPDRWVAYKGSCYLFGHGVNMTFVEGEHFCNQHYRGHLVEVQSNDENLFLKDFLRDLKGYCYWNGLTDESVEGVWVWYYSNTVPEFFDWGPLDPNGGNGDDCVVFYNDSNYDYKWADAPCSMKCPPVCKISAENGVIVGK